MFTSKPPIDYSLIKQTMLKLGYAFFEGKGYDLNIIGVRMDLKPNSFSDLLYVIYKDEKGFSHGHWTYCSTKAGNYYLLNPMNKKGTAILKAGQYRNVWSLGKHNGKYEALVQRGTGAFKIYRDNNKDLVYNLDEKTLTDSWNDGINLHRGHDTWQKISNFLGLKVDKYSAGCQVIADKQHFEFLMNLVRKQIEFGNGSTFSYTLLNKEQIINYGK